MIRHSILLWLMIAIFTSAFAQQHTGEKYTGRTFTGEFDALSISGTGTLYIKQGKMNLLSFPRQSNVQYNMDNMVGHLYINNSADSTLLLSPYISKISRLDVKGGVKVVFLSPITLQNPMIEAFDNAQIQAQLVGTIMTNIRGHGHSRIYLTGHGNIGLDMTLDGSASVNAMALGLQNLSVDMKDNSTARVQVSSGIAEGYMSGNSTLYLQLINAISDIKRSGNARVVEK